MPHPQSQSERISFEDLRALKDAMPPGATERIAQRLGMPTEAVRAVFAAEHDHHDLDPRAAIHMERSPHGAYILIQDNAVLQAAREMVGGE